MFFLLKSTKWTPYRDYWFEVYGTMATTCVYGLVTVLMMPILLWIMRRGENGMQFWFGLRRLENIQCDQFFESIVVNHQRIQIPFHSKGLKQGVKSLVRIV